MSVPPPRSDRRTRGTLALLLGATLWAALGGAVPLAVARTELGALEVERLIGRLEHGVFT
jgi:hypothetical protein